MKWLQFVLVFSPCVYAADDIRQECIGRSVFEVSEPVSWAAFNVGQYRFWVDESPMFSSGVGGVGDHVYYADDGLLYKVSFAKTREQFEYAREDWILQSEDYVENLHRQLKMEQKNLKVFSDEFQGATLDRIKAKVAELQEQLASAGYREFDIGLPDAFAVGRRSPDQVFLWRNNRVYYFWFTNRLVRSLEDVKNLMARFEPRDSHQIPKGPGVCVPYGFIHDDGLATFSIKSSLRFDSTPNVVMSMLTTSANYRTKRTLAPYETDDNPSYDDTLWKKSSIEQAINLGRHQTVLKGWRLDPLPGSGEEEHTWFATAAVGGRARPLFAVHMQSFPKFTGDLQTLAPPPEKVIPKFLKITQSLRDL
ncbi:hypothetical protein KSS94_15395 [Pseudomonas fakonensis]|uniref:Tle cognate immunity protein 4 C-terminal domain-containing protein n=1 Tax=Pseudomonas fakonensis TaxID=2842355 RepID=A0ABX8N202_9PSED|nr:T6SS immunity protein Tli4 family protein [Pseudomonas fakonensis]QXH49338.1 hypothetical protein KSS94_15395 [Pseudomonas fakonensis]